MCVSDDYANNACVHCTVVHRTSMMCALRAQSRVFFSTKIYVHVGFLEAFQAESFLLV